MGWAAFGAAAGSLLGSAGSAIWSSKEAAKQRKWQERMARHKYRYTMEDMQAAGLNPILAAEVGGSMQAPGGALAHIPDLGGALGAGLSAGAGALESTAKAGKVPTEKQVLQENINTAKEVQETNRTQQALNKTSALEASARTARTNIEARLAAATLPHAQILSRFYQTPEGVRNAIKQAERISSGDVIGTEGEKAVQVLNKWGNEALGTVSNSAKEAKRRAGSFSDWFRGTGKYKNRPWWDLRP